MQVRGTRQGAEQPVGPRIDPLLERHAQDFYDAHPLGTALTSAIVRSGWILTFFQPAEPDGGGTVALDPGQHREWLIRARPPAEIANSFDLQVEVLFYVSEFMDLQARNVERVRACVDRDPRVSRDIAFLVTGDEAADDKIAQIPRSEGIIPLSWGWLRSAGGGGQGEKPLRARLEKFLYARDLFDVQIPVVGNRFFGRQQTLQFLKRHAVADQPVGVFGLRKIGKTSVVKAFVGESARWTGREPLILPVHVDLQAVPPGRRDQTYVLWEVGRRSVTALREHPSFTSASFRSKLFGLEVAPPRAADVSVEFDRDLHRLMKLASRVADEVHLVVVFDEVERLVPPGTAEKGFDGAVELLRYLRGLNQEGARVSMVVAGANAYFAERALIAGQENPLLNFIVKHYLAPLQDDEARFMIQRLGGMMGVRFHHQAASAIVHHAGGHPFLTRQLCSVVIKRVPRSRPLTIAAEEVESALGDFSASQHHTFEQMFASLADYPDEQFLLRQLARGDHEFVRAWSKSDPLGVEHLKGYGLIEPAGDGWELTIPLLREYALNELA